MTERFEQLPITQVHESLLNPRQHYSEKGMEEITASIREQGIIQPLLVRPSEDGYEIAAGHRRYRGACAAGLTHVPAVVREMTHAKFLEVLHVENLQREDVHPLEEGLGYRTLMEKAEYDVEAIAAKVGKSVSYVYQRLKLADLTEDGQNAFWSEELTAGHAILIARLQPPEQVQALEFMRLRASTQSPVSVRQLGEWIATHVHLRLTRAPFRADDAELLPAAGACQSCPKRTGANPALFEDIAEGDTCTDPTCYQAKTKARLKQAESELKANGGDYVKLSQGYGQSKGAVLSHNEWREAHPDESGPNVKMGVIKDGPDKGKVIKVRIQDANPVNATNVRQSPDAYGAARKAEEERENKERGIRMKIVDAILLKVKWPLSRPDLESVIYRAIDGTDAMDPIAERHGLGDVRYETRRQKIQALLAGMSNTDLARFAVEALLMEEADGWLSEQPKLLLAAAKKYGVDAKRIRAEVENPQAEVPKPAVKKATAKKKPAAKPKAKARK